MYLCLSLSLYLSLSLSLSFFWSGHISSSLWSNVSKVTGLSGRSLYIKTKSTLSESVSDSVTRSPNELFWTAKKRCKKHRNTNIKHSLIISIILQIPSNRLLAAWVQLEKAERKRILDSLSSEGFHLLPWYIFILLPWNIFSEVHSMKYILTLDQDFRVDDSQNSYMNLTAEGRDNNLGIFKGAISYLFRSQIR